MHIRFLHTLDSSLAHIIQHLFNRHIMERKVEDLTSKTQLRINRCTHRRLTIEHELGQQIREQTYQSNQHFHKYREQAFHRKINHLKKTFEQTESLHPQDESETNDSMLLPNYSNRIQNHFRLLNFSSDTEKRLLQRKSVDHLPRRNSVSIDQCVDRLSLAQANPPRKSSARHQQQQSMLDEQIKQLKNDQRKAYLLKEFDELKHTIEDPHSTYSVLAALSRAILFLDSGTE